MFARLQQTLGLWLREKTGLTANFLILMCIAVVTVFVTFIFLCVSAYAWAATELGPVFGGLATAGVFLAIAAGALAAATLSRARARQRATLERAARTRHVLPLMDPKMLRMAIDAGRNIGWQRLVSIALLGFLATQLAKERRYEHAPDETI
jgi:uncharacterized membrane protein (DUF485 family)